MAACLTVSGEMDDEGPVSSEYCIYNNLLQKLIVKEKELLIWGTKHLP
jgi:hypothetical protein